MIAIVLAAVLAQEDTVDRLIEQLGDDRIEIWEQASASLRALDKTSAPALRRAIASDDPEVRLRALELLAILPAVTPVTKIYQLEYAGTDQVTQILRDTFKGAEGFESSSDPRTRSVIIRSRSAAQRDLAEKIVAELDEDPTETRNYVVPTCRSPEASARILQELLRPK
jgi:HEAT repeat protein